VGATVGDGICATVGEGLGDAVGDGLDGGPGDAITMVVEATTGLGTRVGA
jgi:hypothetical protein